MSNTTITDGGWGTQLQQRGLELGTHPDVWNLTNRGKVLDVAKCYVNAGSQIILTNTFGASRFVLAKHNLADKVNEINQTGVEISKEAAGDKVKVFASMGPSGLMIMMGQVTEQELFDGFQEQAKALAAGGADAIVVETMSDATEAAIAVRAAKTTGLPVVGCVVFDSGKDKDRTMMGQTPEQAVEQLTAAGADVIGSNCGQGIDGFIPICKRMRAVTDLPLWMKGNAGLPNFVDGKTVYTQTPEQFAEKAIELTTIGANYIGGCCGTSPEFIMAIAKKLQSK
ncbi:MAG: homocysteine S-methyltransferase family protein [Planctomycetaceae bacterium]|jgi:methionine synthase I (cobalamin-dependent)|nr:homocysteine S-methyltransferase family protein [Planctomycetaceae bacterium]